MQELTKNKCFMWNRCRWAISFESIKKKDFSALSILHVGNNREVPSYIQKDDSSLLLAYKLQSDTKTLSKEINSRIRKWFSNDLIEPSINLTMPLDRERHF